MIVCDALSKLFPNSRGIFDIELRLEPGTIYGIVGANGAGKTTLLRCLNGLALPTSGTVRRGGADIWDHVGFSTVRRTTSYVPTEDYFYEKLSCRENIELAAILRTKKRTLPAAVEALLDYFELRSVLDGRFGDCSTGERKKAQVVGSLVSPVDTLIWDEPNDGIDILSNMKLKRLLERYRDAGKYVIVSSHVIEFLDDLVDRLILLHDGRVVAEASRYEVDSLRDFYLAHAAAGQYDELTPPDPVE